MFSTQHNCAECEHHFEPSTTIMVPENSNLFTLCSPCRTVLYSYVIRGFTEMIRLLFINKILKVCTGNLVWDGKKQ